MYKSTWLFDRRTDLTVFLAPLLIGAIALWIIKDETVVSTSMMFFLVTHFFGLGPFHLGPGWSHFTNPKIFKHILNSNTKRLVAIVTVLSILTVIPLVYVWNPIFVLAVFIALTIHHLTQQNIGILKLYHNTDLAVVPDIKIEAKTINWASWFFSSIFILRTTAAADLEKIVFGIFALFSFTLCARYCIQYIQDLRVKQQQVFKPINPASVIFWLVSMLFLSPLALIGNGYTEGIMIPLVMHWVQYLAINWVLLRRKQRASNEPANYFRNFLVCSFILTLVILGCGTIATTQFLDSKLITNLLFGFILSLSFVHYLQDAFLWRFSQPVLREELLNFIKYPKDISQEVTKKKLGVLNV